MKKLFATAVIAAIWLSTVSTFAFTPDSNADFGWGRGMMMMWGFEWRWGHKSWKGNGEFKAGKKDSEWARFGTATVAALQAKDYDAFVKAWNADQTKVTAPTQDDFTSRVERQKTQDQMETAIDNDDYTSFVAALKSLPAPTIKNKSADATKTVEQKIPTQEEFTAMVNHKKNQDLIQTAIKSNDYSAFLTARNANKPTVPTKDQFTTMTERISQFSHTALKKGAQILKGIKNVLKDQ